MNILIPHKWLLEHLDTQVAPKELQSLVSLSGPSIERIYDREDDQVYDVEITTNRVDSMSVRGFAREAAVILAQYDHTSTLKPLNHQLDTVTRLQSDATLPLPTIKDNPELNKRTLCVVLDGIERAETPNWMATRLIQTEMNVHDAAIDITNYVTHELGHPCHAFDYDKIMAMGGEIHVVEAKAGETFTTLDGTTYETKGGEVVFKNGEGDIIDLPSIKGTQNTSIDGSTKRILLLAESIRSDKVRYASMTHAIRTTAAQLLEKNLDPNLATETLALAVHLYQELCQAQVASPVYDSLSEAEQQATNQKAIVLHSGEISRYLGISMPSRKVTSILEQLGCQVSAHETENQEHQYALQVVPPSFRSDLHMQADFVEEIARIYGYHNLPSTLPDTAIPTNYQPNTNFGLEHQLKLLLAHTGWQEVYTYSMVSEALAMQSGYSLQQHLKLLNPLTEDMTYLRRSLLPSLVAVLASNPTEQELSVFEWATVYKPTTDNKTSTKIPDQPLQIALVTTQDFRILKGSVESILETLYVTPYSHLQVTEDTTPKPGFKQSGTLEVTIKGKHVTVGTIGILEETRAGNSLAAAELSWEALLSVAQRNPVYQPLPKTSIVTEDLTVTVPEKTEIGSLIKTISSVDPLITHVEYLNQYKQNISFRLNYHDATKNISSIEVDPVRNAIIAALEASHAAKLVGNVDATQ